MLLDADILGDKAHQSPIYGELSGSESYSMGSPGSQSYLSDASETDFLMEMQKVDLSEMLDFDDQDFFPTLPMEDILPDGVTNVNAPADSIGRSMEKVKDNVVPETSTSKAQCQISPLPDLVSLQSHINEQDTNKSGSESEIEIVGEEHKVVQKATLKRDTKETEVLGPVTRSSITSAAIVSKAPALPKYSVVTRNIPTAARTIRIVRNEKEKPAQNVAAQKEEESFMDKTNKNAMQARINRQKKKAYVQGLEKQMAEMTKENRSLNSEMNKIEKQRKMLAQEVDYLKSVLYNDSALSDLLQNIGDSSTGVRLSTSFAQQSKRRASAELDHDYQKPAKKSRLSTSKASAPHTNASSSAAGVCLHVDNGSVSLEFCSKCARMAQGVSSYSDE